jgi:uncharacterized BrkB/YihY/UPF0761 family membrane protein
MSSNIHNQSIPKEVMKKVPEHKEKFPSGLMIGLSGGFVFIFVKNLLSRSQMINFFDRQGFNNVVIYFASIVISIGLGLIWIYIVVKYRKRKQNKL